LTERLCRLVLLEMLPALADADAERFGAALTEYGQSVGNYFKPVQGGEYANPQMAELAHWLRSAGIRGVAQTSWGPTLAVCCADSERAQVLNDRLRSDAHWNRCPTRIVGPLNTGAAIQL
jgi:beta-ribofuranosylaminobenzene 5'-phosphate synthase